MRRGEEMHSLRLFIDITRSDFKKDRTIYEFLFPLHPELFCKVTGLDLPGPWYSKWNRNLCPWFMNDKAILIFAEDLPVLEDGYEAEAMYPLVEGGAIWNASITIAFIAPRCEENHMFSSCFHVYPSHSLLFSNSFSKFICQCYSKNCLLPIIVIMNSNNWCLLFV